MALHESLPSSSFLEYAFLRWILGAATSPAIGALITAQREVSTGGHTYRLDYALETSRTRLAIELDGFEFHSSRPAFSYDRLRQNDLLAAGWQVLRFSYDSIRRETKRCVEQLQAVLSRDPELSPLLLRPPRITPPEMPGEALHALQRSPTAPPTQPHYFDEVRCKLNLKTLRSCQQEAFAALANYYANGGQNAACVMAVGAGKTALGVVATLVFARRRALVVTPGNVIRGTFDNAFDATAIGNTLYGLPGGPLLPGSRPPRVKTLDRDEGPVRHVTGEVLRAVDVIVTNFHAIGTGNDEGDLLAKLRPDDIDFIVVDEAHIAATESYRRLFAHFARARTLLMSACFQRLDGKPIDADIVYRYRLIDSIADGNAKNLRVQRFAPTASETTYEMLWPDGRREELVGREALLEVLADERRLSRIVARSDESLRQVMRVVKAALDRQASVLSPIKPRVLFSALGQQHAEQIARIAEEHGIRCAPLHYSMPDAHIRAVRERFEKDSGDLQGIVQLKMLGQGYDFPPIAVVVPIRPYGSFSEFYQFIGRGIRILQHPALANRLTEQLLDIVYHAEFDLDGHIEAIYRENDMDPQTILNQEEPDELGHAALPGESNFVAATQPDAFVVFDPGDITARVIHDQTRVDQRRLEREREALAASYAAYAQTSPNPVSFEKYQELLKVLRG